MAICRIGIVLPYQPEIALRFAWAYRPMSPKFGPV